jgi:D-alanyl-lipoteichoic acid acyltransferase DltB (MBOAT superfamily)
MIFHSLDFIAFFLITTAIYWALPARGQNAFIVFISYLFYGWVHPWFLSLVAVTTVVDYWAARAMEARPARKKLMLGASLAVNLGLLGFFKYFNFFVDNVQAALRLIGLDVGTPTLTVLLPVGISFYTFQELSYTIEVYRGTLRARRNFVDFAAFVCFYPQLVAGPIERASRLLPQIERGRTWSWPLARAALFLIVWGYFKKLVIADNVGVIANKVFALDAPSFPVLWAGVFAFAIQIYADFSAYSDIARGVARWLGFDLMVNFSHPYLATGPVDFWRRWHISLSSWFRDYVYIPLGGSRQGPARTLVNVFVTFVVSGLWHGASWNYVLWGAYHGALVVISRLAGGLALPRKSDAWAVLEAFQIAGTFVLVCLGWLMFRETDVGMLWRDLTLSPFSATLAERQVGIYLFLLTFVFSIPLWIESVWVVYCRPHVQPKAVGELWGGWQTTGQAVMAGALVLAILVLRSLQSLDFIYFQF